MADLLAGLEEEKSGDVVDLLEGIDESGGTAWVPEAKGDGIQGTVKAVSTTTSDFGPDPVPVVNLVSAKVIVGGKDVSGDAEEWRVVGYAGVLSREIKDAKPEPGGVFAAKYFGKKPNKAQTGEYHHYKAVAAAK